MNDQGKFNILIVDDERSNIDVLMHILKPQYGVRVAKSGASALKLADAHQPDLILLDVVMEDMSGFDALARLKESNRTRHIPVIFVTGLASAEDEERGFRAGAVDYIGKPFNSAVVLARVATHLKIVSQMRTIERLGIIDALTDIPNRRAFEHQISVEWRRAVRERKPISLLFLDVDKFKQYNDAYGHPQGDVLLQELARTVSQSLKRPTDLCARLGGEEFAVILPDTDADGALLVAEQIRRNVAIRQVPCPETGAMTSVTVSIGLASKTPGPDDRIEDMMAQADAKLNDAKQTGRNRVCV